MTAKRKPRLHYTTLDQVDETVTVPFLIPGFVPRNALTTIEGHPGTTKSFLTLTLAAYATAGLPMPAGMAHEPAIVVVFNPEDDDPEVLARVIAAGGSPSGTRLVTEAGSRSPRPIDLSRDLRLVRDHCEDAGVKMAIFDNLGLALVKAARTEDATRDVLYRLTTIAKQTETTILAIRHFTKNARGNPVHAGSGRVGMAGAARAVTHVGRDPDDPNLRVWAPVKVNGSPPGTPSLLYEITDTDLGPAINWLGTTEWSADDLLRTTTSDRAPKLTEAEQMLRDLLADGPRLRSEIKPEAVRRTIGWRTVEDAKANLGVRSRQIPVPGARGPGPSWWALPDTNDGSQP